MQDAVRALLLGIGEDPEREGLLDTPKRVSKALLDMTEGYRTPVSEALGTALFHEPSVSKGPGGLVLVRDIDFASTSDASLLPFHGRCHVAYVPSGGVVLGLSKLARLARLVAKRVQSQERMAADMVRVLAAELAPFGAAVAVEARHMCYGVDEPPPVRLAVAADGCLLTSRGLLQEEAAACMCLEVAQEHMVDVDTVAGEQLPLGACAGCCHAAGCGGGAQRGGSKPAAAGPRPAMLQSISSGLDVPLAPVTPDPSEGDDSSSGCGSSGGGSSSCSGSSEAGDSAASCSCLGSGASCSGSLLDGPLCGGGSDGDAACAACGFAHVCAGGEGGGMVAAVHVLLSEAGVLDGAGSCCSLPGLQSAARRYVLSLLAATAGYHLPLPCAYACGCQPRPGSSSCSSRCGPGLTAGAAAAAAPAALAASPELVWHTHHVPFMSQCEHHMLPFYGSLHIAYLLPSSRPGACPEAVLAAAHGCGGACGACRAFAPLSAPDLQQLVAHFTRRLQVQERITQQVADALAVLLPAAAGVLVVARATHMCMVARGVENHAGSTLTRAACGVFAAQPDLRARFLRQLPMAGGAAAAAAAGAAAAAPDGASNVHGSGVVCSCKQL